MKIAAAFAVSVALMLLVVVLGDQLVGLSPATPSITADERLRHLPLVIAALSVVVMVDLAVVCVTLRRSRDEEAGRAEEPGSWQ